MELTRDSWKKSDVKEFQEYLKSFENKDKQEWAQSLIKTSLPVLSLKTATMYEIIDKIAMGNYLEFLDLIIWEYYENTSINGFLITKIKDFKTMKKYLDIYINRVDNWASCDLLSFDVIDNEKNFFKLSEDYLKSDKPFVRRLGLYLLFYYIEKDDYIDIILDILNRFELEEHYYVNMMNAWLLSECFIRQREKTLKFLKNNKLNKFAINKGIQKCRDSRRVSKEDKEMLIQYKKK